MGPPGPPGDPGTINGVAAGGDLTGTYPDPTIAPPPAWTTVSPAMNITGGGAGDPALECYVDRTGTVHLEGSLTLGGADVTRALATLPSMCPAPPTNARRWFPVAQATPTSSAAGVAIVSIESDGAIFVRSFGTAGELGVISFDGVSWRGGA